MALDRRVAVDDPTLEVAPGTGVQADGGSAAHARRVQEERLDRVPTQRGPLAGTTTTPLPDERPAAPDRRPGRVALVVGAVTASVALVVAAGVVQHQASVRLELRRAEEARLAAVVATIASDELASDLTLRDERIATTTALAQQRGAVAGALATAGQVLDSSPHAGDEPLAALRAAVVAVTGAAAAPLATAVDLDTAQASLAAPVAAVQQAEAAWQAAEAARIEAERKAAEEAARQAAEQAAAQQAADAAAKAARSAKPRSASTSTQQSTATAPVAGTTPSTPTIPSGGLVCPGAPTGGGAGESSVDAIGAGINAYRQSQGLPALAVGRSGGLVSHAIDMATAGGIWHSGSDNIVGCTSGSVQSLITAWSHSAPHNAQMLRTDVSSMAVGGGGLGGWLYGAVKFN